MIVTAIQDTSAILSRSAKLVSLAAAPVQMQQPAHLLAAWLATSTIAQLSNALSSVPIATQGLHLPFAPSAILPTSSPLAPAPRVPTTVPLDKLRLLMPVDIVLETEFGIRPLSLV